jgi:hypothetical protein
VEAREHLTHQEHIIYSLNYRSMKKSTQTCPIIWLERQQRDNRVIQIYG